MNTRLFCTDYPPWLFLSSTGSLMCLYSATSLQSLFESRERIAWRCHQPTKSFRQKRFHVFAVHVRVAADHVVLLANGQDLVDGGCNRGMVILAGKPEILGQVAFSYQHNPDPRHLFEHLRQVPDRAELLANDHNQDFAFRVERPDVGAGIIFLLRQSPVWRRVLRRVAALARRLEVRRGRGARVGGWANR